MAKLKVLTTTTLDVIDVIDVIDARKLLVRDMSTSALLQAYMTQVTKLLPTIRRAAATGENYRQSYQSPQRQKLSRFPLAKAIGIAGISRSKTPTWMEANLPPVFEALARLGTALTHYKVCSTLDSSPEIGSIGRAVEIANPILGGAWVPTLVAAPPMGRWQSFGHLFATAADSSFRLDRHPIMSRHPITPMTESDVAVHLSRQTEIATDCMLRLPTRLDEANS